MFDWLFGKKETPEQECHSAECELPQEVLDMREEIDAAKEEADDAAIKMEQASESHRHTLNGAGTTFTGLTDTPEFQALKKKWEQENLADA